MKLILRGLIIVWVAAGSVIVWKLTRSYQSEVVLSSGVTLTPEWQKLTPPRSLMTEEPWSEVMIEMPTFDYRAVGNRLLLEDGTSLSVDAYLVTEDGKEITLDRVSPAGINTTVILELSTDALQWKTRDYRFRTLALRSNKPVRIGKVLWMSYDPRETQGGVAYPRSLG